MATETKKGSKRVKNDNGQKDIYKVKDHPDDPKNFNLTHIIARNEADEIVAESDFKLPKLEAPIAVWAKFFGNGDEKRGELELKANSMRNHVVTLRGRMKSKKGTANRGGLSAALS